VSTGSGSSPGSLKFGPDGNLWVALFYGQAIKRYNGTTGADLGTTISVPWPAGIAFGPDGNLYATERYVNMGGTVQRYNGTSGASMGAFAVPSGVQTELGLQWFPTTVTPPPACTFSESPTSVATVPASGGSRTFTVSASPSGCSGGSWTASVSNSTWMGVSPASGTAAASVTAAFAQNPSTIPRSGTITIAGQSVTITQAGATQLTCTFSVTPTSVATIAAAGGSTTFTVKCQPERVQRRVMDGVGEQFDLDGRITGERTTAASVTATYLANTSTSSRSGTITIAGQSITVNQAGASLSRQQTYSSAPCQRQHV